MNQRRPSLQRKHYRWSLRHFAHALALGSAIQLAAVSSVADNLPDIGEPADQYLSPQKEALIGSAFLHQAEQQNGILHDPEIRTYLQSLGARVSSGVGQQHFHFFLVKNDRINAFAVPGGYVGIHAGLMLATRNESELAGVVAHEIAHITQRHIARFYAQSANTNMASIGAILAGLALAMSGSGSGAAAVMMAGTAASYQGMINHTRSHEKEADRIGIQYLAKAGFDPKGLASFFEVMQNRSLELDKRFEILRTHPLDANRIAEAQARTAQMPSPQALPDDRNYQLAKARLVVLAGDNRELLSYFRDKSQGPLKPIERYTLAQLLTQNGNYASAQKHLDTLLEQHSGELAFQLAQVRLDNAQKRYQSALKRLETLHQLYPQYSTVVDYMVTTLRHTQNFEAITDLLDSRYDSGVKDWPPQWLHSYAEALKAQQLQARSQLALGEYYIATARYRAAGLQIEEALDSKELGRQLSERAKAALKTIEAFKAL